MRIGRLMGLGALLTTLVVASGFVVLILMVKDLRNDARDERRAADAVTVSADLRAASVDLETAVRGYVISRDPAYLAPYRDASLQLPTLEERIVELAGGDQRQRARARSIVQGVEAFRTQWVVPVIAAVRGGNTKGAAALLPDGKQRLDALRSTFDRFDATARVFRDERHSEVNNKTTYVLVVAAIGLGASTLVLISMGVVLRRLVVLPLRRLAAATQRLASGDYAARVASGGVGEAAELGAAFNTMAESLEEQRDELEAQNSELEAQQSQLARSLHDLELEHARTAARSAFGTRLASEGELAALCHVVLEGVADLVAADVGALSLRSVDDANAIGLAAVRGLDPVSLDERVVPDVGLAGRVLTERRAVAASAGDAGVRVRAFGRDVAVRHELHVPLVVQDEALGVVTLGRIGEPGFTADEIELVDQFAYQAALALANALSLAQSRRLLGINSAVLDAAVDGVAMLEGDSRFAFMNTGMERMVEVLGIDLAQDMDVRIDALAERTTEPVETADALRLIAADGPSVVHELIDARTGRAFELRGADVEDAAGSPIGRLVTMRETTSEREAARLKDEFVATVSHELRTPLTSINGYVEILLDDEDHTLTGEQRHFLEVIARSSERLMRLVGDLLLVGQIDAGKLELVTSTVDLRTIVTDAAESARAFANGKGVDVRTELNAAPPVLGDPARLAQVVDNLLSNAIKFTPEGGDVAVTLSADNGHCVLEVSDSGIGIPEAERSHLFERFFRTSRATAHAISGTGLGLAITKAIVDGHGGSIAVVDRDGPGTTFRIELPARVR